MKTKIEKLYNKLEKKFDKIYWKNNEITDFYWYPNLVLKDKDENKITVILEKGNKE